MNYILGNLSLILIAITSSICFIFMLIARVNFNVFKLKLIIFIFSLFTILVMINAYLTSDFTLLNVFQNSYSDKPIFYKLAAIWANHEGSLLIFVFLLSLCNLIIFNQVNNQQIKLATQKTVTLVIALFSLYIFFASNPFILNKNYVANGMGLNPILQDFALIIHPPILYLGYVISILIFAFTLALITEDNFSVNLLNILLKLQKLAFITLTLGIALGSWWAYRELGWGGYWFWDPVENLALLIWLFSLISLHSNIAILNNKNLLNWFVFANLTTFLVILLSFFVVRSGILVSVHSFADDPYRGVFLLAIFFTITAYVILTKKNCNIKKNTRKKNATKNDLIKIQNFLVSAVIIIVAFGVFFPLLYNFIMHEEIFIGANFYNKSIFPILLVILVFMALLPQKKIVFSPVNILIMTIIGANLIYFFIKENYNAILVIFAAVTVLTNFYALLGKKHYFKAYFAHSAFALIIIAIALNNLGKYEVERVISVKEPLNIGKYELSLHGFIEGKAKNYLYARAQFELKNKKHIIKLQPEQRYYLASDITTKEVYIKRNFLHDIYLVIGEIYSKNKVKIRFIYNPYINLIWLGALLLILQFFFKFKYDKK